MLRAVPKGWFSSRYNVSENDAPLAAMDFSAWRESGELTIGETTYRAYREGLMSGSFVLEGNGSILVRAEKPSALYRSFLIAFEGKRYTLEAKSSFSSRFILSETGKIVGSAHREGVLARKALADFPEDIQLPVRLFMLWLVMILWRRADSASTG